jgi:hypothetical protein
MRMLLFALAASVAAYCGAGTVYKTVDADGKVSFSDQPPPAGTRFDVIDTPDDPAGADADAAAARLQEMRETTERMRADRLEREEQRAQQQPYTPYAEPSYYYERRDEDDDDYLLVPYYPDRRHRPHPHPRPHPRPPYYEPEPPRANPDSLSPRGLQERLRQAR